MNQFIQKNQSITYYILTIMVIGILAARTNSFYSPNTTITTILSLMLLFTVISFIRSRLEFNFIEKKHLLEQSKRQLEYELFLYIFIGIVLFIVEVIINKHTDVIASKLLSGVIIIGYFASIDSALKREHDYF